MNLRKIHKTREEILKSTEYASLSQTHVSAMTRALYGFVKNQNIYEPESSITAYSSGGNIVVNTATSFLQEETLEDALIMLDGLRAHECGHELFTDIEAMKKFFEGVEKNNPNQLKRYGKYSEYLKDNKNFKMYVLGYTKELHNVFEDAFVNLGITKSFHGSPRYSLKFLNDKVFGQNRLNLDEEISKINNSVPSEVMTLLMRVFHLEAIGYPMEDFKTADDEFKKKFVKFLAITSTTRKKLITVSNGEKRIDLVCQLVEQILDFVEVLKKSNSISKTGKTNKKSSEANGESKNSSSGSSSDSEPNKDEQPNSDDSGDSETDDGSENSGNSSDSKNSDESENSNDESESDECGEHDNDSEDNGSSNEEDKNSDNLEENNSDEAEDEDDIENDAEEDFDDLDSEEIESENEDLLGDSSSGSGGGSMLDSLTEQDVEELLDHLKSLIEGRTEITDKNESKPLKPENLSDTSNEELSPEEEAKKEAKDLLEEINENEMYSKIIDNDEQIVTNKINLNTICFKKKDISYAAKKQGLEALANVETQANLLSRKLLSILKDREVDEIERGFYSGKKVFVKDACKPEGKIFGRRNEPTGQPKLKISILVDESGSMNYRFGSTARYIAAREKAILFHKTLSKLGVAHEIVGHSADEEASNELVLRRYVNFEESLSNDINLIYKLGNIDYRYQNRDGAAITHCCEDLLRVSSAEDKKLLIVISDGEPSHGGYIARNPIKDAEETTAKYGKQITICGLKITNSDTEAFEKIYGDKLVDCSTEEKFSKEIAKIIQKYVVDGK